jgi:hypothetical protein
VKRSSLAKLAKRIARQDGLELLEIRENLARDYWEAVYKQENGNKLVMMLAPRKDVETTDAQD